MECDCASDCANDCDIKSHTVKHAENEYKIVIGITLYEKYFLTLHNDSSSIYFEIDDEANLEQMFVILTPDKPLYQLTQTTLILCDDFVMVNYDNIIKIYNATTLQHIDNIFTEHTIKGVKINNKFIILDCNIEKNGKILYHYELYNFHYKRINIINKQIMFIDNSQYKNNFLVFFDDKIATKLYGKYFLYDAEDNVYLKIDDTQFNLDNCMIFSSNNKRLNVFGEDNCVECSICFDVITEYHALVPCGHMSLCTKCYKEQKILKCPICRKNIEKRIKIYK